LIYVKDYKCSAKPTWRKAIIKDKLGVRTYLCKTLDEEELIWKKHTEQIVKVGKFYSKEQAYLKQMKEENKGKNVKELEIVKERGSESKRDVTKEEEKAEISITYVKPERSIKPVEKLNL